MTAAGCWLLVVVLVGANMALACGAHPWDVLPSTLLGCAGAGAVDYYWRRT